jgi:hypothetical protein
MAYQLLKGIQVTPKGTYNTTRFSNTFQGNAWPTSYAFGGWIYNASSEIGFSNQPSEIKLNIVLETIDRPQTAPAFNIQNSDLKCDAGNGADENLYDIDFNGILFTDFILYSYDISIENNSKILTVVFKDYSIILDKIYVGLLKRQGNKHVYVATSLIQFPVNCPDCMLAGDSFTQMGSTLRDINYGSYVGINGGIFDNFAGLPVGGNIYRQWEKLFQAPVAKPKFDLNGGYLIIGTEDVSEEKCGDLANISYNFNQLLASLRIRGFLFEGAFPITINDSDFIYRQNYIGTLREVLQQWCSDLGYDFYCEGKRFIGINIDKALDITKVTDIADPTTELGANFALNANSAIISYKENNSINNTFKQSVITANNRPRQTKTHSKNPKRYVGFLPLHPIDFNSPSTTIINRQDAFGNTFKDVARINSFKLNSPDLNKTLYQLDNRTFKDVDTSIALSHYDSDLRDIYCQDRALYGETLAIREANFKALGMFPLIEITDSNEKSIAIEATLSSNDEISNICLDSRFYKVYIGYYYPKFKEDTTSWEQQAASDMYKFGAITKGLIRGLPYMPSNVIQDTSPNVGLYGSYGVSLTRIKHSYEPNAKQFYDLYEAPFKDIILYSGLKNTGDYFSLDLYIGEISNDWGTTPESFKRDLTYKLSDACVDEYQQDESYTQINFNIDKRFQDWKLALFKPQIIVDIKTFFDDFAGEFAKISGQASKVDRTIAKYYDLQNISRNTCSKLHIFVLTDTRQHPNIYVEFKPRDREFVNGVVLSKYLENEREAIKRRAETRTLSTCDKSLLQEMCDGLLTSNANVFKTDPKFACALQDEYNAFEEGFDISYLSSPNSRGLDIKIIKNPTKGNSSDKLQALFKNGDANGDLYYIDTIEDFLSFQQQQVSMTIVYPISVEASDNIYYKGILTSDVEVEHRSPEIVEIFGEPINTTNNSAAGIKIINNNIDPDLQPQLDPFSSRFVSYITVVTGDSQIITTVSGYHNFIKQLNNYQATGVSKSIELSLAGTPDFFGSFKNYLKPIYGLNKMSIGVTDNGVVTSLSYADKPPQPPKQESILNKISPRIV